MSVQQALESGHFNSVPYMTGATGDEWYWSENFQSPYTEENYASMAAAYLSKSLNHPVSSSDIARLYPASSFDSPMKAYGAAAADVMISCQRLKFADLIAKVQPKVWVYEFAPASVPDYTPGFWGSGVHWGSFHGSDIQYWFENFQPQARTAENLELSSVMRAYLTNFASKGDPNGGALPRWQSLRSSPQTAMKFATPIDPNFDVRTEHKCSFWENYKLWWW